MGSFDAQSASFPGERETFGERLYGWRLTSRASSHTSRLARRHLSMIALAVLVVLRGNSSVLTDLSTIPRTSRVTEFIFCLPFKLWLWDFHRDDCCETSATSSFVRFWVFFCEIVLLRAYLLIVRGALYGNPSCVYRHLEWWHWPAKLRGALSSHSRRYRIATPRTESRYQIISTAGPRTPSDLMVTIGGSGHDIHDLRNRTILSFLMTDGCRLTSVTECSQTVASILIESAFTTEAPHRGDLSRPL